MIERVPTVPISGAGESSMTMLRAGSLYLKVYFPSLPGDLRLRVKPASVVETCPVIIQTEDCKDDIYYEQEDRKLNKARNRGDESVHLFPDTW